MNINADVGESYGRFRIGNDSELMPHLDRCNIACGFHGGDPKTILLTIDLALHKNVSIGAHPSYLDLLGFGRRYMEMSSSDLYAMVQYQLSVIDGLAKLKGGKMEYVKPHGALYHALLNNKNDQNAILEGIAEYDQSLKLLGFHDKALKKAAEAMNLTYISEIFLDRAYNDDGRLVPRSVEGSVLTNIEDVLTQLDEWKKKIDIDSDDYSFCIHGDNPSAIPIAEAIRNLYPKT